MSTTAQQPRPGGPVRIEAPKAIKPRRRHGLIGLGVALVVLGALAAGWLVQTSSTASQVLAVKRDVAKGAQISAGDLVAVPMQDSSMLHTVAAGDLDKVVNNVATSDLRAGSLLAPDSYASTLTPGDGKSLVGISLDAAHRPGVALHAGDTVRFIQAPIASGDVPSTEVSVAAVVVSTTAGDSTTGSTLVVNVEVDVNDAARLAALGASGRATLLIDAPGARPTKPAPASTPESVPDPESGGN